MISIVICSKNDKKLSRIKENINRTIGCSSEFIIIDNKINKYSLANAYNIGIEKARFDIICFLHEDIEFLTEKWGVILLNKFSKHNASCIGIAGTDYLSEDGIWFSAGVPYVKGKIIHSTNGKEQLDQYSEYLKDENAVVIDGVFIAARKETAASIRFDENLFDRFHFYDIDFSFRLAQKNKLIVTQDISLKHYSGGSFDEEWEHYRKIFVEKHKENLPFSVLNPLPKINEMKKWNVTILRYPRILIGCPTSYHKEYCLERYITGLKNIQYPNFDILLVDNSDNDEYYKKIQEYNIPAIKGPYFKSARERIIKSRNILREKVINEDYDYFFSLEQDVVPPPDVLLKLINHNKKVISCVYFLHNIIGDKSELTPQAFVLIDHITNKNKEKKLPDMRPLNNNELSSNKLIKIISCGLGCVLIHKDILKEIEFRYDKETEAFDDRWFCIDLYNKNMPLFCDTGIMCMHYILNRPYSWSEIQK